ncbi:MAG: hypothetical protein ABIF17_01190 [Patescibacteria group bacterium]
MSSINILNELFSKGISDKTSLSEGKEKKKNIPIIFILFIFGFILAGMKDGDWISSTISAIIFILLIFAFRKQKEKMNAQDLVEKHLPQNVHNKYKEEWYYKKLIGQSACQEQAEKTISDGRAVILILGVAIWTVAFVIYLLP